MIDSKISTRCNNPIQQSTFWLFLARQDAAVLTCNRLKQLCIACRDYMVFYFIYSTGTVGEHFAQVIFLSGCLLFSTFFSILDFQHV